MLDERGQSSFSRRVTSFKLTGFCLGFTMTFELAESCPLPFIYTWKPVAIRTFSDLKIDGKGRTYYKLDVPKF
jgi:hypothetical protein